MQSEECTRGHVVLVVHGFLRIKENKTTFSWGNRNESARILPMNHTSCFYCFSLVFSRMLSCHHEFNLEGNLGSSIWRNFWASSVDIRVFPNPTCYMLTSFGSSILRWYIPWIILNCSVKFPVVLSFNPLSLKLNSFNCN